MYDNIWCTSKIPWFYPPSGIIVESSISSCTCFLYNITLLLRHSAGTHSPWVATHRSIGAPQAPRHLVCSQSWTHPDNSNVNNWAYFLPWPVGPMSTPEHSWKHTHSGAPGEATIICSLGDPWPPSHSWKGGNAPDKSWLSWLLLTKKWHCWSFLDGLILSQHSWHSWCSGAPRSLSKVCWWDRYNLNQLK